MKSPSARAKGRSGTHGPASSAMPGPASSGPNPLEALRSGRLTGDVGLGPKVPTDMIKEENNGSSGVGGRKMCGNEERKSLVQVCF